MLGTKRPIERNERAYLLNPHKHYFLHIVLMWCAKHYDLYMKAKPPLGAVLLYMAHNLRYTLAMRLKDIKNTDIARLIFLTLGVLIALGGFYSLFPKEKSNQFSSVVIGDISYRVEIAKDDISRERGLGGRESVASDAGMLFVFDTPGEYGFWMKDTLVPLDMIWISSNKTIVHIEKDVQPSSYPAVYTNDLNTDDGLDAALYVLEVASGEVEKNHFQVGEKVSIFSPELH